MPLPHTTPIRPDKKIKIKATTNPRQGRDRATTAAQSTLIALFLPLFRNVNYERIQREPGRIRVLNAHRRTVYTQTKRVALNMRGRSAIP